MKLTPRGEAVVVILALLVMGALLLWAMDHGLDKQRRWDCHHGVQEAC